MTDDELYYEELKAEIEKEEELLCDRCGSALYSEYGPCGRC